MRGTPSHLAPHPWPLFCLPCRALMRSCCSRPRRRSPPHASNRTSERSIGEAGRRDDWNQDNRDGSDEEEEQDEEWEAEAEELSGGDCRSLDARLETCLRAVQLEYLLHRGEGWNQVGRRRHRARLLRRRSTPNQPPIPRNRPLRPTHRPPIASVAGPALAGDTQWGREAAAGNGEAAAPPTPFCCSGRVHERCQRRGGAPAVSGEPAAGRHHHMPAPLHCSLPCLHSRFSSLP